MRTLIPTSRGYLRIRFSVFDTFWAMVTPVLALYISDALILKNGDIGEIARYTSIALAFSLIAFLVFRLNDGLAHYFSVHDALNIVKAACVGTLLTTVVLFYLTRLNGIPRSMPVLHLLILASGLVAVRALALARGTDVEAPRDTIAGPVQHILLVGATRLSAFYIKFLRAYAGGKIQVMAVVDDGREFMGRSIIGVPVLNGVINIDQILEEFEVHGVKIARIVVGDQNLSREALGALTQVANERQIYLQYVSELVGFADANAVGSPVPDTSLAEPRILVHRYHTFKRVVDFTIAGFAILALAPAFVLVGLLVLIDVGTPILFWQQRMGRYGDHFLLYKFRTLHAPFDRAGATLLAEKRLSATGKLLRKLRLDELPQLFNVLVGDMSLIGPRPLLRRDQPEKTAVRLAARPGITGWAQVNGGNLITAEEKGALDEFYVRNASVPMDLRIIWRTFTFLFTGERRAEEIVAEALRWRQQQFWNAKRANAEVDFGNDEDANDQLTLQPVAAKHSERRAGSRVG